MISYIDSDGNKIIEDDGWLFVNGECVAEPGTDEQLGKYDVDVMNGDGYYNSNGIFVRYRCYD